MKTPARVRIAIGRTVPIPGTYGSIRVDVAIEDDAETGEDLGAARKRIAKVARRDLRQQIRSELRDMGLDPQRVRRECVKKEGVAWVR